MKKLSDLQVRGKRVLVRVDYNVPLDDSGAITDDSRIKNTLPTLTWLINHGAKIILLSHLGRPGGKVDTFLSVKPTGKRLSELLKKEVKFSPDCIGQRAEKMTQALKAGEVLLLENVRFHKGEENPQDEPGFTESLAHLGDCYVNDAFGAAHRKHSSVYELPKHFPGRSAPGLLMQKELEMLMPIVHNPGRPFYAIIGGKKIGSKIGVIDALLKKSDQLFVGGGMAYTFFKAMGHNIGDSILDTDNLETAKKALCKKLILPVDIVAKRGNEVKIFHIDKGIDAGWEGMDIGPETIRLWQAKLSDAKTIFWNGPVGVFEKKPFDTGTVAMVNTLAHLDATTIIGGGDSLAAVSMCGLGDKMTHLSTGGGASLELIEKGTLPGIDVLENV